MAKQPSNEWLNVHAAVVEARARQAEIEAAKDVERRAADEKYPALIARSESRLAELEPEQSENAIELRRAFAAVAYGEPGAESRRARALARREWLRLEREQYVVALEVIRADYQRDLARIRRFNAPAERANDVVDEAIATATAEFLAAQPA